MSHTPHVTLTREGAEALAERQGLRLENPEYFLTEERSSQLQFARRGSTQGTENVFLDHDLVEGKKVDAQGTVGAVVLDPEGHVACATSTGGMTNKMVGRVGDTPIIGAGLFANEKVALCATGRGEAFMRHNTCGHISAAMEYGGLSLQEAASREIGGKLKKGDGGIIGVTSSGELCFEFVSPGMFRAYQTSSGKRALGVWEDWM